MKRIMSTVSLCCFVFVGALLLSPGYYECQHWVPDMLVQSLDVSMMIDGDLIGEFISKVVYAFYIISFPMIVAKTIINKNNVIDKVFSIIPVFAFIGVIGHGIYMKTGAIVYEHGFINSPWIEWDLGNTYYIAFVFSVIACIALVSSMFIGSSASNGSFPDNHKKVRANLSTLKEYKDLLDGGAITQEEYDAKKKQLLDL